MALKTNLTKTVNFNENITDEKDATIVTLGAAISTGNTNFNISKYIADTDLYIKNKSEVRTLISEFEDKILVEIETMEAKDEVSYR